MMIFDHTPLYVLIEYRLYIVHTCSSVKKHFKSLPVIFCVHVSYRSGKKDKDVSSSSVQSTKVVPVWYLVSMSMLQLPSNSALTGWYIFLSMVLTLPVPSFAMPLPWTF